MKNIVNASASSVNSMRPRGSLTSDLNIKEISRHFRRGWLAGIVLIAIFYFLISASCFADAFYVSQHNEIAKKFNALSLTERQVVASWDGIIVNDNFYMVEAEYVRPKDLLKGVSITFYIALVFAILCYPSIGVSTYYLYNKYTDIAISDLPLRDKTCRKVFLMCYAFWPVFLIDFIFRKWREKHS